MANPKVSGLLLVIAVGLGELWIVTAGWSDWPQYTDDYRLLTEGFLHGHLSLSEKPSAELLALRDPYDPEANERLRLHDAALFDGKYYLYWGPAPALLAAAVCWPLRIWHPTFGDQDLVVGFMLGVTALATVLILQVRRRLFPGAPDWTVAAAVASLGLSGPVMFTVGSPGIYEAAIIGGQFFLIAGLMAGWFALVGRRWWLLGVAGVCWTLAVGSRLSLGPAVVVIAAMTAWGAWRRKEDPHPSPLPEYRTRGKKRIAVAAMMTPLCAGMILLGWYNLARFGSVGEFGLRYQLAGLDQREMTFFSLRPAAANAAIYLFMPPYLLRSFPFMRVDGWQPLVRRLLGLPPKYLLEATLGLVWTEPFLIVAAAAAWRWRRWKADESGAAMWLAASLAAGAVLGIGPALLLPISTMRYEMDFIPCCAILAVMGCWAVWEVSSPRVQRMGGFVIGALTILQVGLGFMMGMNGYYHHFAASNPGLLAAARQAMRWVAGR